MLNQQNATQTVISKRQFLCNQVKNFEHQKFLAENQLRIIEAALEQARKAMKEYETEITKQSLAKE